MNKEFEHRGHAIKMTVQPHESGRRGHWHVRFEVAHDNNPAVLQWDESLCGVSGALLNDAAATDYAERLVKGLVDLRFNLIPGITE
jgi:hypothetical protein